MNRTNKTPGRKRGAIVVRREAGDSVIDLRAWAAEYVRAVSTYGVPQSLDIRPIHHLPKAS